MALSKREQALIDRYKESGRVPNEKALDAPFLVLVRPLASAGLDSGRFALWFEEEISAQIEETGLTLAVRRIMISPHIINPEHGVIPSRGVSFSRRENAIHTMTDIDFLQWIQLSDDRKLATMHEHIRRSILNIPGRYVDGDGRERLLQIVDSAYGKLQHKLAH